MKITNRKCFYNSRLAFSQDPVNFPPWESEHYLLVCALADTYNYESSRVKIEATIAAISRTELDCQPEILEGHHAEMREAMPAERERPRQLLDQLQVIAWDVYIRMSHDEATLLTLTDPLNIHGRRGDETVHPWHLLTRAREWSGAIMTLAFLNVRVNPDKRRRPTIRELAFPLLCCWHDITEQRPSRWIVPPSEDRPAIGTAGEFIVDGLLAAGWNFMIDEIAAEYKPLREKLNRLIRKAAT